MASTLDDTAQLSKDNIKGLVLVLSSSFFIGTSFIVKKKSLKKAGASGISGISGIRAVILNVHFFCLL